MAANVRFPIMETITTVVLIVAIFFVAVIVDVTIFGVVITTAIFYAFWYYYRRSKSLEKLLAGTSVVKSEAPAPQTDESALSPSSTDA